MKKKTLIKTLIGLTVFATILIIVITTQLNQQMWRCEVCMTYNEKKSCKSARGPSKKEAYQSASDTACALISSGVTERMACPRQQASSQVCEEIDRSR